MQFTKKTSSGKISTLGKFLTKVILVFILLFIGLILISKINFPEPNKKIEKIIPNETFKTLK